MEKVIQFIIVAAAKMGGHRALHGALWALRRTVGGPFFWTRSFHEDRMGYPRMVDGRIDGRPFYVIW